MPVDVLTETLYTIPEIADQLKIDRKKTAELFDSEPGVIIIGNKTTTKGLRKYRTIRVPASVFNRVVARLTNRAAR
jgi:hypothetical protein